MSKSGTTVSTQEKEPEARGASVAPEQAAAEGPDLATEATARGPVRTKASPRPAGGPNKNKPAKSNRGNRSSRAMREAGASDAAKGEAEEVDTEGKEEEEEDKDTTALNHFWQFLASHAYASRKSRGDWGGEGEG